MPTQTLPIPTDAGTRDALLERVRALAALRHPCVEPVAAVDVRDDGTLALRRGGAAADLPTVLAVRGRLTSREAAGVLVAVARGLAALHSAGLRQGSLGARDVVLGPGGGALLRPHAAGPVGAAGAASDRADGEATDVHALATLVADLLGDRSDDDATALRAVLAPAAAPDPRVRPEAGTLAAQADAAVVAEPVRLPEPASLAAASLGMRSAGPATDPIAHRSPPTRRRSVRRRDGAPAGRTPTRASRRTAPRSRGGVGSRRLLGALGAVGVVAALAAVAVQVRPPDGAAEPVRAVASASVAGRSEPEAAAAATAPTATAIPMPDPAQAPDPTQDRDDPSAAAAELTRRRVALLSGTGQPGSSGLADLDAPGSPAHDADAALLADAARAGTRVRAAEARLDDVTTRRHAGDVADVVVRYAVGAHEQVARDGTVTAVPETDPRSATLRLTWTPDGWRVAEVD
ncbi:hypothetical protein [Krasilnikoviella flava]|uniref:hypothetical protein n=1 Tax=Krasilnikoviella flava TaxID=526729 RepID=UPI0009A63FFB|nr:hypothetical protein [Krasilnikoviella flava]